MQVQSERPLSMNSQVSLKPRMARRNRLREGLALAKFLYTIMRMIVYGDDSSSVYLEERENS
ncbi:MAG: hypothetical protein P4L49_07225 [Desulfosporosinus sp.]|nr:hypothetical protein [Desulfosporosinus sp.]